MKTKIRRLPVLLLAFVLASARAEETPEILTPKPPPTPRINGPSVFGVHPGSPFVYRIPATGQRPMEFSANLPDGLNVNAATGNITGKMSSEGKYKVTLRAKNSLGESAKNFLIVVGDTVSLTPAMGWNSWNCWGARVTAEKVLQSARGMAESGLIEHGWTYINIDDAWQASRRGGPFNAIQGNSNFPDMKGLCEQIHGLGLKAGIYSTPWTTSYANHIGGSSENPDGAWERPTGEKRGRVNKKILPWAIGRYSFATNDARQWAAWGIDYLKETLI